MIKFLSGWIEGIAIAVIIASIFEMIIPKGNIQKYIKVILGIYVIFSIISPFVDSKALYSMNVSETIDEFSENVTNQNYEAKQDSPEKNLNKIYKSTFEKDIIKTVENEGFVVYKCSVEGVFDAEQEDAGISKIEITVESRKKEKNKEKKTEKSGKENSIKVQDVKEVEKVEVSVGEQKVEESDNKVSAKDVDTLKKFISKHYEVEKGLISVHVR